MRELLPEQDAPTRSFEEMFKQAFVDLKKAIPNPPIAISMGQHMYRQQRHPNVFGTYGNFSAIVGDSKTKKSFMKSLIMAGYIGGNTPQFGEITSHRKEDKIILDFDTEQSKFHSARTFKRVERMVGKPYPNYMPFCLRKFSYFERLAFIEHCILERFEGQVGLVSIDGYADLCSNTNDIDQCNELIQKLMYLTDVSQCHMTGILHTAHGTTKATGHLGSFIQKKSETVCVLSLDENDPRLTKVNFKYTRGFPISDFGFRVDADGLPRTENLNSAPY